MRYCLMCIRQALNNFNGSLPRKYWMAWLWVRSPLVHWSWLWHSWDSWAHLNKSCSALKIYFGRVPWVPLLPHGSHSCHRSCSSYWAHLWSRSANNTTSSIKSWNSSQHQLLGWFFIWAAFSWFMFIGPRALHKILNYFQLASHWSRFTSCWWGAGPSCKSSGFAFCLQASDYLFCKNINNLRMLVNTMGKLSPFNCLKYFVSPWNPP